MDEETYKAELKASGVELPELKEEPKEETPKEPAKADEPEKVEKAEDTDHLQNPKDDEKKPPSIYDRYKDEKSSRKEAETRAEKAERERDEMAEKLRIATEGKGDDPDNDADDAIAYAKKVNADPDLVKRIIDDARKGIKPEIDPDVKQRLERFEAWEKSNAKTIEVQRFNEEFESAIPTLKKLFPNASDDEMKAIKSELDTLSHTKDGHDKPLDFLAFKNQDTLTALVSPKKRGMESKDRKDVEDHSTEFDPNADFSSMTPTQRANWEQQYRSLGKSDGLLTDGQGRKIIV